MTDRLSSIRTGLRHGPSVGACFGAAHGKEAKRPGPRWPHSDVLRRRKCIQHMAGTALFEERSSLASASHFDPYLTESRTAVR